MKPSERACKGKKGAKEFFNTDGEPGSGGAKVLTIGRIVDAVNTGNLQLDSPIDAETVNVVEGWVSPTALWKLPLLRVCICHELSPTYELTCTLHIYASRLLFYCIADPSLKILLDRIVPVLQPFQKLEVDPPSDDVFESCSQEGSAPDDFSPDSLLFAAESTG